MKRIRAMMFLGVFSALVLSGRYATAAINSGKVEWVWQNVKGDGAFVFKLVGDAATYTVQSNPNTTKAALAQVLTSKSAGFNLAVDWTLSGADRVVNSLNVMDP